MATPALTTVEQPMQAMGEQALRMLLELLAGGTPPAHVTLADTRLVVRHSTAPPARRNPLTRAGSGPIAAVCAGPRPVYARRMTGNSNIAVWVADRAVSDPHLPAIKQGDTILSYAALDGAASRFATQLAQRGVRAGDRVALIMPNVAYFPIVYYAILRLGAVVVPMNPLLKAGEIAYTWDDAGARVAVVFPLFAEEAQKAASSTGTEVLVTVPQEFEQSLSADRADRRGRRRRPVATPPSSSTPPARPGSPRAPS